MASTSEKIVTSFSIAVFVLFIGGVVFCIYGALFGIDIQTGSGEHTGYVTAIEEIGVIFKTNRAYVKTDTMSSQEDTYCVTDPSVYATLQAAALNKTHVDLYYKSYLFPGIKNCDGENAIITGVNEVQL